MLKKIPRQIWIINIYGYFLVAGAVVITTVLLLNGDHLGTVDMLILVAVLAVLGAIWWRFHPRLNQIKPEQAPTFRDQLNNSATYSLLAFESEYCPFCMTIGGQVERLQNVDGLTVYRLSVTKEPGQSLYRDLDGRLTPTYFLLDRRGKLVQEWPIVLPVERIVYEVNRASAS